MQHLEEGTIHAWIDDALSPEERREVEAHLASCEACSQMAAEARGLVAASSRILTALDDVPGDVIPVTPPTSSPASTPAGVVPIQTRVRPAWHTPFWVRTAAAVVMIAGVSALVMTAKLNRPEVARQTAALDTAPASDALAALAMDTLAPPAPQRDLATAETSAPTGNQAQSAGVASTSAPKPGRPGSRTEAAMSAARDRFAAREDSIAAQRLEKAREEQMTAIRADAAIMRTRRDSDEVATVGTASSQMRQAPVATAPVAAPSAAAPPSTAGGKSALRVVREAAKRKSSSNAPAEAFGTGSGAMATADRASVRAEYPDAPAARGCYVLTMSPWSGGSIPFGAPPPKIELDTIRNAAGQLLVHPGRGTASNGATWAYWTQAGDSIYVTWRDDSRGVRLTLPADDADVLHGRAETLQRATAPASVQSSTVEARRISCRE